MAAGTRIAGICGLLTAGCNAAAITGRSRREKRAPPDPLQIGNSVNHTDPISGYPAHDRPPPPGPAAGAGTARRTALTICTIADVAAGLLVLWIVLHLLDANEGNGFVDFVHTMADWLSGWAQDIFTMDTEGLRIVLNYGLPAIIYLLIGHGIAARLNRA